LFFLGCSLATTPSYIKEEIDKAIQDICKLEYKLDIKARLIGQTLWVYLPAEDILEKSDKPEKFTEKFSIETNKSAFVDGEFKVEYAIKQVPDEEKSQEYKFNKDALEKNGNVWKVIRRVLFSMERAKEEHEPKFLCVVTADIKNGFVMKEIVYITDLKKVSYQFISWTEYQHRAIQDIGLSPGAIGDKEGGNLDYKDIALEDFLALQIQQRIKLKFHKPEVEKNADVNQEILKIVIYTIKTYQFKNFNDVELANLANDRENKIILNRVAVWARPID
jgi:hypothetical protein